MMGISPVIGVVILVSVAVVVAAGIVALGGTPEANEHVTKPQVSKKCFQSDRTFDKLFHVRDMRCLEDKIDRLTTLLENQIRSIGIFRG